MQKKSWLLRIFVLAVPLTAAVFLFLAEGVVVRWAAEFPKCPFYKFTGLYCPACGNTRSVLAMLRLDLPAAARYNITPLVASVFGILFYLELAFHIYGKRVRLVPRSNLLLAVIVGGMLFYYLVRNFFI